MPLIPSTKINLEGNKGASQRFIKFATAQLAILERQMSFQKLNEGRRVISPFNGVEVICLLRFGKKEIIINVSQEFGMPTREEKILKKYISREIIPQKKNADLVRIYLVTSHCPIRGDAGIVASPEWNGITNLSLYMEYYSLSPITIYTCCVYDPHIQEVIAIESFVGTSAPGAWPRTSLEDGPWDYSCDFSEVSTVIDRSPSPGKSIINTIYLSSRAGDDLYDYGQEALGRINPEYRFVYLGNTNLWQFDNDHSALLGMSLSAASIGGYNYHYAVWINDTVGDPVDIPSCLSYPPGVGCYGYQVTNDEMPNDDEMFALLTEEFQAFIGPCFYANTFDLTDLNNYYRVWGEGTTLIVDPNTNLDISKQYATYQESLSVTGGSTDFQHVVANNNIPFASFTYTPQNTGIPEIIAESSSILYLNTLSNGEIKEHISYSGPLGTIFSGLYYHRTGNNTFFPDENNDCTSISQDTNMTLFWSSLHSSGPIMANHYPTYICRTPNWHTTNNGITIGADAIYGDVYTYEGAKWNCRFLWNFKGMCEKVQDGWQSNIQPNDNLARAVREMFVSAYDLAKKTIDGGNPLGESMIFENSLIPSSLDDSAIVSPDYIVSSSPGVVYGEPILQARLYFVATNEDITNV